MPHRTAARPQVTQLEDRLTPAALLPRVSLDAAGLLAVVGTARSDVVRISREARQFVVRVGGWSLGEWRFDAALVRRVEFHGGAGNDTFFNDTAVAAIEDGGAG